MKYIVIFLIFTNLTTLWASYTIVQHIKAADDEKLSEHVNQIDLIYAGFCDDVKMAHLDVGENYQRLCGE